MPRGYSISIGLNAPQSGAPGLDSAEGDAASYAKLFGGNGYEADLLVGAAASRWAVLAGLHAIARVALSGDVVAVTFSGVGGRRRHRGVLENFWQCCDGPLTHADLRRTWSAFASGVRVLVIDDCCYSSGPNQERPHSNSQPVRVVTPSCDTWHDALISTNAAVASTEDIAATVLCLSSCSGDAAWDGCTGGMFTEALLRTWNRGGFRGSYDTFCKRIRQALTGLQTPELVAAGPQARLFEMQRPFALDLLPTEVTEWQKGANSMKLSCSTRMMLARSAR